jgi:pimeloyl-ACP methyl ester carboxylesterase
VGRRCAGHAVWPSSDHRRPSRVGGSDDQPRRRISGWPADIEALADDFGIDRFSMLGYSGGCPYAVACAARLPERVIRVVLVGVVGPFDVPGLVDAMTPRILQLMQTCRDRPALGRLLLRLMALLARLAPGRTVQQALSALPPADQRVLQRHDRRQMFSTSSATPSAPVPAELSTTWPSWPASGTSPQRRSAHQPSCGTVVPTTTPRWLWPRPSSRDPRQHAAPARRGRSPVDCHPTRPQHPEHGGWRPSGTRSDDGRNTMTGAGPRCHRGALHVWFAVRVGMIAFTRVIALPAWPRVAGLTPPATHPARLSSAWIWTTTAESAVRDSRGLPVRRLASDRRAHAVEPDDPDGQREQTGRSGRRRCCVVSRASG